MKEKVQTKEKKATGALGKKSAPQTKVWNGATLELVQEVLAQINHLLQTGQELEQAHEAQIEKVHPAFKDSSKNLLQYLAFRKQDNRVLQSQLASLGLSSLGRAEGHVRATLLAVKNQLHLLLAHLTQTSPQLTASLPVSVPLQPNIEALLGKPAPGREGRIMITFSTDLADDYKTVRALMKSGMNCARINCAHDDITVWQKMVEHIKRAEEELGQTCKILFDLMGPKLRTGPIKEGPKVIAIHPKINEVGEILSVAKVWLAPKGVPSPEPVEVSLRVAKKWISKVQEGDSITFRDTRGRRRRLRVVQKVDGGLWAVSTKSAYVTTGTELVIKAENGDRLIQLVGKLPAMVLPLVLQEGQELLLHRKNIPGEPARFEKNDESSELAHISCTLPEIFTRVKPREPIWFDDGEIEGEIQEVHKDYLKVKITAADEMGSKLRPDKGINLPESDLHLNKLTAKDREDLAAVVPYADIINLSFVSNPGMVEELQQELLNHNASHVAIMLKIETKAGFDNLPHLLLTLMRHYPAGVMIARGDLAVELGWQRLAEVQEEILWIAEAAHLPVVWATQVLEKLTKKGRPSRAEITDAAMAQRADCVMLNKGPYILKSIAMLDDIMKRMQEHQYKKTSLLRMLHVSAMNGV